MKLFEHVAVAASSEDPGALVLRSELEQLGLRVHLYRFYQKRNVEDFFASKEVPSECRYTVEGWQPFDFDLTKDNIPGLVTAPRGTLVASGCRAGREPLAKAFLEAGYEGDVGATENYVGGDSALLFVIGFFYHLLAEERDFAPRTFTDKEAAARAAAIDEDFELGTRAYRYWSRKELLA